MEGLERGAGRVGFVQERENVPLDPYGIAQFIWAILGESITFEQRCSRILISYLYLYIGGQEWMILSGLSGVQC